MPDFGRAPRASSASGSGSSMRTLAIVGPIAYGYMNASIYFNQALFGLAPNRGEAVVVAKEVGNWRTTALGREASPIGSIGRCPSLVTIRTPARPGEGQNIEEQRHWSVLPPELPTVVLDLPTKDAAGQRDAGRRVDQPAPAVMTCHKARPCCVRDNRCGASDSAVSSSFNAALTLISDTGKHRSLRATGLLVIGKTISADVSFPCLIEIPAWSLADSNWPAWMMRVACGSVVATRSQRVVSTTTRWRVALRCATQYPA